MNQAAINAARVAYRLALLVLALCCCSSAHAEQAPEREAHFRCWTFWQQDSDGLKAKPIDATELQRIRSVEVPAYLLWDCEPDNGASPRAAITPHIKALIQRRYRLSENEYVVLYVRGKEIPISGLHSGRDNTIILNSSACNLIDMMSKTWRASVVFRVKSRPDAQ